MVSIDSVAVFEERLVALGLASIKDAFTSAGWSTLAGFAFSSNFIPGQTADDRVFVDKVVLKLVSSEEDAKVPAIRRLFFEAYTMAAADLKRRPRSTRGGRVVL